MRNSKFHQWDAAFTYRKNGNKSTPRVAYYFLVTLNKKRVTVIHYNDRWVKVIFAFLMAHFLEIIGREESTLELLLQPFYYKDVLSGWLIGLILFEFISRVVKKLDLRYDWEKFFIKRLVVQLLLGVFASSLLCYFLVYLQFRFILNQRMNDTTWLIYEFPFAVVFIILINGMYLCWYYILQFRQSRQSAIADSPSPVLPAPVAADEGFIQNQNIRRSILNVRKGNMTIPLAVEQIAYIYKDDQCNYVKSIKDEKYITDFSLDELEGQLDESIFFRANRQTIVALRACQSFSPQEFGKLGLQLHPSLEPMVIISQKRAPQFRKWINR